MLPELCLSSSIINATLPPGFCVGMIPVAVNQTRTLVSIKHNQFLALERSTDSVLLISSSINNDNQHNDSDPSHWLVRRIITEDKINHGLTIDSNYIYASTDEDVYRWSYNTFDNTNSTIGTKEHVIYNITGNGTGWSPYAHMTRTLLFDPNNEHLYISIGSSDNVDNTSYRSRIRRFSTSLLSNASSTTTLPLDFDTGEVYIDGVRNTVGMGFDPYGILWGVDNAPSDIYRDDLGGNLSIDNPADKLLQFNVPYANYGYPYCFTEYLFPTGYGLGIGTSWAWPTFLGNGTMNDTYCQTQYKQTTMALQGHSAPLGITFYQYNENRPEYCKDILPFPLSMNGYAFIAFHGSAVKSRAIPTGYSVVYVPIPLLNDTIQTGPIPLLRHTGDNTRWDDEFRPVDVKFDDCGCLLVSSDGAKANAYAGSKIVRIYYYGNTTTTNSTNDDASSTSSATSIFTTIMYWDSYSIIWLTFVIVIVTCSHIV